LPFKGAAKGVQRNSAGSLRKRREVHFRDTELRHSLKLLESTTGRRHCLCTRRQRCCTEARSVFFVLSSLSLFSTRLSTSPHTQHRSRHVVSTLEGQRPFRELVLGCIKLCPSAITPFSLYRTCVNALFCIMFCRVTD
jgi:hypothetical protein